MTSSIWPAQRGAGASPGSGAAPRTAAWCSYPAGNEGRERTPQRHILSTSSIVKPKYAQRGPGQSRVRQRRLAKPGRLRRRPRNEGRGRTPARPSHQAASTAGWRTRNKGRGDVPATLGKTPPVAGCGSSRNEGRGESRQRRVAALLSQQLSHRTTRAGTEPGNAAVMATGRQPGLRRPAPNKGRGSDGPATPDRTAQSQPMVSGSP